MTDGDDDLVAPESVSEDVLVADVLDSDRPTPAPDFSQALALRLAEDDPGWGPRPDHLWLQALSLVVIGAVLVLIGALISTGGI